LVRASAVKVDTIAASPPIMMPRLPKFAIAPSAYAMMSRVPSLKPGAKLARARQQGMMDAHRPTPLYPNLRTPTTE
jgi:hypothetical protein